MYYEELYTIKLDDLDEIDKFLETQNLLRLNHKEIQNQNRPITNRIISVIEKNKNKTNKKTTSNREESRI